MNEANYCTLEAAKRLVEAGIVLETDMVFEKHTWLCSQGSASKWALILRSFAGRESKILPAPTMAEVWCELPEDTKIMKLEDKVIVWVAGFLWKDPPIENTNPTDALIELLIWVRREAKS